MLTRAEKAYIEKKQINERTLESMKARGGRVLSLDEGRILTFCESSDADQICEYVSKIIDESFIPKVKDKEEMLEVIKRDHPFFNLIREYIEDAFDCRARELAIKVIEVYNERKVKEEKESNLGAKAYTMRRDDNLTWTEIGKRLEINSPIHTARVYAKTNKLEWPLSK